MSLIRTIILTVLIAFSTTAYAGGEVQPRGARSMALGNSSVMLNGIWSAFNNQAGLVEVNGIEAAAYYQNLFSMGGLADQGFVVGIGKDNRALAIDISTFGQDVYSENRFGLAYAMRLGEKLDMGIQMNYHRTNIAYEDYGSTASLTAELGLTSHLTEDFDLSFHVFNPFQTQLSEFEDERLPSVMSLGGAYSFSDKVMVVSEVTKDIDTETMLRAGIEYRVVETVYVRGGISTEPTMSSFGAGIEFGDLVMDIAASYHHVLGYSTQLSLSYSFNNNAN